jgi:hypothetical protein
MASFREAMRQDAAQAAARLARINAEVKTLARTAKPPARTHAAPAPVAPPADVTRLAVAVATAVIGALARRRVRHTIIRDPVTREITGSIEEPDA